MDQQMAIQNDQAALEQACDAYSDSQERHGLSRLSEGEKNVFEAGWEAAMRFVGQSPKKKSKKIQVEEALRLSDLTAQEVGRTDIEYGHHETLPRGEHVARITKQGG